MSEVLLLILHLGILAGLTLMVKRKVCSEAFYPYYLPALYLKLCAGILYAFLILHFYEGIGDTFTLFEKAHYISELLDEGKFKEWISFVFDSDNTRHRLLMEEDARTLFFVKPLSLLLFIVGQSYWCASLYFSFFSFICSVYLISVLNKYYNLDVRVLAISFLFFPGVVIWSSGLLKEPLLLGAICLTITLLLKLIQERSKIFLRLTVIFLLLYFLHNLKYYYAVVLLACMVTALVYTFLLPLSFKNSFGKILSSIIGMFVLMLAIGTFLHPNLDIKNFLNVLFLNYSKTLESEGSNFSFYRFSGNITGYLINFPIALFTGLFRPLPLELKSILGWLTGLENLFLLAILSITLYKNKWDLKNRYLPELTLLLIYIFIEASMLSFASPNFGSIVRYRVGYYPFAVLLILNSNPFFIKLLDKYLPVQSQSIKNI